MIRALILAAGKGTRLGLKKTPKCMVKVNGKPILEHLVNHLNKAGITEVIVNVHKDYDKIFKYFGTRLLYLYEPTLLGENGTINILEPWLGEEFVVMNGDTLTNVDVNKLLEMARNGGCYILKFVNPDNGHFAGTMVVNGKSKKIIIADEEGYAEGIHYREDGEYYFDCGTPAKLAKARRFYKNK